MGFPPTAVRGLDERVWLPLCTLLILFESQLYRLSVIFIYSQLESIQQVHSLGTVHHVDIKGVYEISLKVLLISRKKDLQDHS